MINPVKLSAQNIDHSALFFGLYPVNSGACALIILCTVSEIVKSYFAMIEEVLRDPISVGQLKINGEFMIKELGIAPGPRMGWILSALLEEVLDDPAKNTESHLSGLAQYHELIPPKSNLLLFQVRSKDFVAKNNHTIRPYTPQAPNYDEKYSTLIVFATLQYIFVCPYDNKIKNQILNIIAKQY